MEVLINGIGKEDNLSRIAIVVVGYNRLDSIKRLLSSLEVASYPSKEVPLVISVDCSGDEGLYDYVRNYNWPHGEKYINIQVVRLGLKKHIFQCCSLSKYFKAVVILEDDSYVAPFFYQYTEDAVNKYGCDDLVCGISLYVSHNNEYVNIPFFPLNTGSDIFLMQDVQTRGECFTYYQWQKFEKWLSKNEDRDYAEVNMPEIVKRWRRAWSKYFYAYMVESKTYFVFPYVSFVTNMGAIGEHADSISNIAQVCLEWGHKKYIMKDAKDLVRYDAFGCNEAIYEHLDLSSSELSIDYYGHNTNIQNRRYILSFRALPYKIIRSFGLSMYPIEVNVLMDIEGKGLFLYDSTIPDKPIKKTNKAFLSYIYCKHNPKLMRPYLTLWYMKRLKYGIKKLFKR